MLTNQTQQLSTVIIPPVNNEIISVYVSSLPTFNGKWMELPMTFEELEAELLELGNDQHKFRITQIETPYNGLLSIMDSMSIYQLNELAYELTIMNEQKRKTFEAIAEELGDYEESLSRLKGEDYIALYDIYNSFELGRAYLEKVDLDGMPTHISDYIDFDRFGRHLRFNGWSLNKRLGIALYLY